MNIYPPSDASQYLERFYNFELTPKPGRFGIENIRKILSSIGSPETAFKAVHIAGTKGKGSTAFMVESILRAHGFVTGLYTSPHLIRIEERCAVNGIPIAPETFSGTLQDLKPHLERILAEGLTPSVFDVLTAAAFWHFARSRVTAGVIEVGLGGRLDSTNVVTSSVSLITTLGLDHTEWLGSTIEAIAAEKMGIVRSGVPVISHAQESLAWNVIETVCGDKGSTLERIGREIRLDEQFPHKAQSLFDVTTMDGRYTGLSVRMIGQHQRQNAASAVRAAELFVRDTGCRLEESRVRYSLAQAFLPARIEVVGDSPTVVIDGAHNPISVRTLVRTLKDIYPGQRVLVVFGCNTDKDIESMFNEFSGCSSGWYLTRNPGSRGADPELLLEMLRASGGQCASAGIYADPGEALRTALADASGSDIVCCTGSFVLAAMVRGMLVPQR